MNFLLSVPECLSCTIVVHWLEAADIASLDTAFCSRSQRNCWLSVLENPQLVLSFTATNSLLRWCGTRKVVFKRCELFCEPEVQFPDLNTFL